MLQQIVEKVTGERLCDYLQENVFDVLGLEHTCFFPLDGKPIKPELAELCAPTEFVGDTLLLKAQVHDPTARLVMKGNSGNAGMFSNVEDIAVICSALLNGGEWKGKRILAPQTVKKIFEVPSENDPKVARALGWDTYYSAPFMSGDIFETQNRRGHSGYTGTSVLIDPDTSTILIILTHRVHPKDKGSVSRMRGIIASITASEAILSKAKADAEAIVKKATEEAEAILAKARKEADDLRVRVEGDVKTASAQALQATKADIESLIVAKAVEPAGAALKEPDFLKSVITEVAKRFSAEEPQDLSLILPEKLQGELEPFVKGELAKAVGKGVEASFSKKVAGGFSIGPKDGSYFISLTVGLLYDGICIFELFLNGPEFAFSLFIRFFGVLYALFQ